MGKITVTPCDIEGLMLLNQQYLKMKEDIS